MSNAAHALEPESDPGPPDHPRLNLRDQCKALGAAVYARWRQGDQFAFDVAAAEDEACEFGGEK